MDSCKDTCDDLPVGRPPTGKTTLRNLRLGALVWFPALARTVADDTTVTGQVEGYLRDYGSAPPDPPLTFAHRPDAAPWLDTHYPAWPTLAAAIEVAAPGLADAEYIGVALWLAMTRRRDRKQQRHAIAGFLLSRAMTTGADGWRETYGDLDALLEAIIQVLDEHLPERGIPAGSAAGRVIGALRRDHAIAASNEVEGS
jgi:hypothetical protein